jgi:oxygen-independent coproporphyrinogen-3 oxidase
LNLETCRQITCELEPTTILGDVGLDKLRVLERMGVERVSMGVQSFDDRVLRKMGRFHSAQNAIDAIQQIRKAGFDNLSIDLIYGYPGFTIEDWIGTLDQALSLGVDAYQMYRLRIEPHGDKAAVLLRRFARSPGDFPSAETAYVMKQVGIMKAEEAGLQQVSRRVFAHGKANNSEYLQDHTDRLCDVLGLGVSSWSSVDGRYYLNTGDSIQDYQARIEKGGLPINRGRIRSDDDLRRWAAAVPIKHGGISRALFQQRTGADLDSVFGPKLERLARYGLVEDDGAAIRLTEKGGFFADEVAIQFYDRQFIPFPRDQYTDGALNPFN